LIHTDSLDVLDHLSDEEAGKLFKAFRKYHQGEETDLSPMLSIAFVPFKNQFSRDLEASRRGEYHWNWKGGITEENHSLRCSTEYKNWRKLVFIRDKYTCRECSIIGDKLNAHHIKPWAKFPELRFEVDNGITLCEECHRELHRGQ